MLKIKTHFAILDVLKPSHTGLAKRLKSGEPVPVKITGTITGVWSKFDGESQEFSLDISHIEVSDVKGE